MNEKRASSLLFLTAGLALLLAYLLIAHFSDVLYRLTGHGAWRAALSAFFYPGYANAPEQWLRAELIKCAMATAALACLAISAVPRGIWRDSITTALSLRLYWRPWVWAVLLASSGLGLAFTLQNLVDPFGFERLQQPGYWMGFIQVVCGTVICARLLFARERRPFEKWLGYVFAALALYGLAWALLRVLGLDLNAMLQEREKAPSLAERAWNESFGIAFGCASAWTGLFIARRRSFAPASVPDRGVAVYLCSASLLFYLGLQPVFGMGRMLESVASPLALTYGAASCAFLVFALLASLHAVRLATGDIPQPAEAAPMRPARSYARLLIDTPIGLAASAGLLGVGYFLVSRIDILALAFLMPLVSFALLAGPVLVFIYGILRGRLGYAIGAALLAVGLFGYRSYNLHQVSEQAKEAVAEAETLNIYPFKPVQRAHDIVAIVDSQSGHTGCFERCRLVLLGSPYLFALEDSKERIWSVMRLLHDHDTCSAKENRASMLDFLAAGRVDTCVATRGEAPRPNALIIRENESSDAPIKRQFPKGFRGTAFEFLERIEGKDEVLGRIVWGGTTPPLLSDLKGERVPFVLDEKGFYAAALDLPGPTPPPITTDQAKAAIAVYLSLWTEKLEGGFHNSWTAFLGAPKEPGAVEALKGAIIDLLLSKDVGRIRFGLLSLYSFRTSDPAFVKEALGDLVTSDGLPVITQGPSNLTELLKEVRGAYPEPQRVAAREALHRPGAKTDDALLALLSLLGHGGPEQRAETAALILALPEPVFQQAMAAMGADGGMGGKMLVVTEPPTIKFWSEADVAEIARRASNVPDARLANYIELIRWTPEFVKVRSDLKGLLTKRLASGVADENARQRLESLRDRL